MRLDVERHREVSNLDKVSTPVKPSRGGVVDTFWRSLGVFDLVAGVAKEKNEGACMILSFF